MQWRRNGSAGNSKINLPLESVYSMYEHVHFLSHPIFFPGPSADDGRAAVVHPV